LPNAVAPVLVQASLSVSTAVLAEAALSFLGVGTQPPAPSWGSMLSESRAFMEVAPWTAVFPGAAIMIAVLGFNLLGDGIRDLLDPRLRNL
jgi:peptide/nickel transport system permease protein